MVYTTISHNAGILTDAYEEESRGILMEMTKMVGALISSLQRSSGYNNNNGTSQHGNQDETHEEHENTGNRYDDDI